MRADPEVKPPKESLLIRPGVLGGSLPALYASIIPIMPGDTLVFAIRNGFDEIVNSHNAPKEIATAIVSKYSKVSDDALVLVARYRGSAP